MIVIPFFLECHGKTTFAADFWVLCALVICTPSRLIQLVLGCGGIMKCYPNSQQSSVYKPWGRQGTLCNNTDVLLGKDSMAPGRSSKEEFPELETKKFCPVKWMAAQHLIFILYSPAYLKSYCTQHQTQKYFILVSNNLCLLIAFSLTCKILIEFK